MEQGYFEWLYNKMCGTVYGPVSYRKLFTQLYETEFTFTMPRDVNRAEDGIDLRARYFESQSHRDIPCSILEMMVALAIRIEETIMDNTIIGDRTAQWFWGMISSMGLGCMIDSMYDDIRVGDILTRFLNREYMPDGRGGLFTIRNCETDLRDAEIWHQVCWYLDNIYE
jgi:hypothetical protein